MILAALALTSIAPPDLSQAKTVTQDVALFLSDVAPAAGVDALGFGRGAAMVDLDGDGLLDLVAVNAGIPDVFFRQLPDHSFVDVTLAWGIPQELDQSWDVLAADFDNDGDVDVFVAAGGFNSYDPNRLLRNDLATLGRFTDVSSATGDLVLPTPVFGATSLDYDRDGLLDIFTCDSRTTDGASSIHLFRNEGDLFFREETISAGMEFSGSYRHCSMGDFDNDGWPDVAVGQFNAGPNQLFRNRGDGTFEDVAAAAGVAAPGPSFGMVLEDFDNDGWQDIYLPRFQANPTVPSGLFRNNGDGTFTDLTFLAGLTGQLDMGHNTGDLDADGHPEIFIGTGHPPSGVLDILFRVLPAGTQLDAIDISVASGIQAPGATRSHGSAFGDYDGDGDVDLYVNTGGPDHIPASAERNILFQNHGNGNGWIVLELVGTASNRSAVGARAVATTPSGRQIHRQLSVGKGFGNTDSPCLHFGLGSETQVDRIEVTWPNGLQQVLHQPAAGKRHTMVEGT